VQYFITALKVIAVALLAGFAASMIHRNAIERPIASGSASACSSWLLHCSSGKCGSADASREAAELLATLEPV
jgi:hypothetical protein